MKNIKKITAPFRIKYRKARVLFGLSILAVTSLIANPVLAKIPAEGPKWLTKYKVIHADPKGLGRSIGEIDLEKDQRIEAYLQRVGGAYKNSGFSAPLLPTKTIDGQRIYVIYLFDWEDNKVLGRTLAPDKNNFPKGLMMFDTSEIYGTARKNNRNPTYLTPRGYAVLGHELFHAIQNGYANKQKYFLGTWITEGTAQAVGLDMFFKYAPLDAVKLITPEDKQTVSHDNFRHHCAVMIL